MIDHHELWQHWPLFPRAGGWYSHGATCVSKCPELLKANEDCVNGLKAAGLISKTTHNYDVHTGRYIDLARRRMGVYN